MAATDFIRFGSWAQRMGRTPTPDEIAREFGVPKVTAYRWRDWLLSAWGIDRAPRMYLRTERAPD